jgi:D-alanyl-D-alanine carboxypeptidase
VSGFRGIDYQAELIGRKLSAGQCLSDILKVSAAPGFSEHHTGNAVDVTTEGAAALDETFDNTDCFHWLLARAGDFGFTLTYPRDNSFGIDYEPWHWCFQSQERSRAR